MIERGLLKGREAPAKGLLSWREHLRDAFSISNVSGWFGNAGGRLWCSTYAAGRLNGKKTALNEKISN